MSNSLVIVESPAKARTISRFLGDDYVVESSVGHIRDLPRNASEVPAAFKSEQWATLGVNPDDGFKPLYVVTAKDQVRRLKSLLRNADELYLATDEDREGEAIAWHLLEVLNPQIPVRRMVFHEITAAAIREAIDNPRELDRRLVDAQEARRIFDRLYGYEVSPVLWRKVAPRLSAGRVQSVANRLIVERERERMAFRAAEYWSLVATLDAAADPTGAARPGQFDASLASLNGRRIATGRDFDQQGELRTDGVAVLDSNAAAALADDLAGARLAVVSRESKPYRRRPPAPFITSTLQQAAGARLGFSASRTMAAAQRLYENGRITYMRTDSTTLSDQALGAARRIVAGRFGAENLPPKPRIYTRKVKNAQEAHEAVRPAGENWPQPGGITDLGGDAARLYDLIWQRTIASQMIDATGETVTIRLAGTANCHLAPELAGSAGAPGPHDVELSAAGTVVTSPGFRLVYVPATAGADEEPERILPDIDAGDEATAVALEASEHSTSPPARFTEASLIRRLEELGVGRPSTYASIIETIQARGYVWKKGSALVPALVAFATVGLMERHFDHLVDYALTARMESDLDEIANGDRDAEPWLTAFYFGNKDAPTPEAAGGLRYLVSDDRLADIDPAEINSIPIGVDADGEAVMARVGRFGPYLRRGDATRPLPDDLLPDELTLDRALELLDEPTERVLGTDPDTGLDVLVRPGRFGPYVSVGRPDETEDRPRTASLLSGQTPETVTLADALQLLTLPRTVGLDPADGAEITVRNGRFGPYLTKAATDGGKATNRSLESEDQLFTLTLDEALALLAQPPRRRGQRAASTGREIGQDPESGKSMVLKDGRFGPYVTDGEYNASLRQGDDAETLTAERAAELLAERRAKGPAKKRAARRTSPAKKKATARKKSAAKKSAARKRAAKKSPAKKKPG